MSTWESVSNLSVVLQSGGQNCHIYANGQNRIGVTITVEPVDEDGNPVQVDSRHLAGNLWLIDYADGSTLDWNGSSGWAYTDTANEFTAIPGGSSEPAGATIGNDGIQHVTFYVYCSPEVSQKSIGVRVKTDSDATITSSQDGTYNSCVTFNPRAAVTYTWDDITWDCSRTPTQEGGNTGYVTTEAWNYYLSLKVEDNYFLTFRVHGYASQSVMTGSSRGTSLPRTTAGISTAAMSGIASRTTAAQDGSSTSPTGTTGMMMQISTTGRIPDATCASPGCTPLSAATDGTSPTGR
ncbi:hypothetical protein GXW82_10945 [Streptacidiphilus sp. 4-A2]|nr:hypothetical protein [Streptacidiphilus sp. 4-A2]